MRLVILGAPRNLNQNRWKDDAAEAAQALGWDVTHVEAHRIPTGRVVELCRGADLLLWARTHKHDPAGDAAEMLRRVEDAGTATVGVHMDLYWSLPHREPGIGQHPWWSCQWVFTADGGPRDWASRGVNHRWLPPAVGLRWLGPGTVRDRYRHDAVFVGNHVPRIHGPHRAALLGWGWRRWGRRFAQYGRHRPIWGEAFSDLCASAGVVLGDSAPAPLYWSDRVPLTLSRGGLLAYPETAGMAGQGFGDETMVAFPRGRFDVLGEKLDALTAAARRRIRGNAVDLIRSRHLWTHRLEHIVEVVFGAGDPGVRRQPSEVAGLSERDTVPSGAG